MEWSRQLQGSPITSKSWVPSGPEAGVAFNGADKVRNEYVLVMVLVVVFALTTDDLASLKKAEIIQTLLLEMTQMDGILSLGCDRGRVFLREA